MNRNKHKQLLVKVLKKESFLDFASSHIVFVDATELNMISWFGSSSTVLTLTIKTTHGELEDKIQIQSDESVMSLSKYPYTH